MQSTDSPEEILDVVDNQDIVIGVMTRREAYAEQRSDFRVVNAFIKNDQGKLWVPRRVATKKLFPNALDFSFAGHVESGESYEDALKKEALEEVQIDLSHTLYKEIGYFSPAKDEVGAWMKIYEIYSNETPDFNKNDFSGYEWLTPEAILELYKGGEQMKSDIPKVITRCYL